MINVLISTYYCTNNYGSFLQAWTLGMFLKKNGCEVSYCGIEELEKQNLTYTSNQYRLERDQELETARRDFVVDY